MGAVWTPGEVLEGKRVALHDPQRLAALRLPRPQAPILAATEQVAAVRGKGQAVDRGAMALQHRPSARLFPLPQSDRAVLAATRKCTSIRTPGQGFHTLRMPHQRLAQPMA